MQSLLADFEANLLWPWVVGAFVLVLGLVVVALHSLWNSPPAVIIFGAGLAAGAARGVVLMVFPTAFMAAADAVIGASLAWRIGYIGLALVRALS